MKKLTALLLALVMILCMAACAPTQTPSDDDDTPDVGGSTTAMTHAEYMAATEDAAVEVECYVQATQSWWDNKIVVYAQDKDGGYFAYNLACTKDEAAKLVPGVKIHIKGYKTFYKGMPEIAEGATFTVVEGADTYIAEPKDMTDLLGKEELVNNAGMKASFKGLTISSVTYKNDAPGDDIYVDVTLGDATYNFCVESYLTDPDTEVYKAFADLKPGDKVDIEGFVYWYDGVEPHITGVAKVTE